MKYQNKLSVAVQQAESPKEGYQWQMHRPYVPTR